MTSRDRVMAALNRTPADRVPVFMWFHPSTRRRLAALLEIPEGRVSEAMGDDVRQAWVSNNYAMEGIVHEREGEGHTDAWGIEWVKSGEFNQAVRFPLEHASREEILDYAFPWDHATSLLDQMTPLAPLAGKYFIGVDVSPCAFEMYYRLRGMERALYDLAADPEMAGAVLRQCAAFTVALAENACDQFPVDWLWTGDDVAGQQSMLMSPEQWRAQIRPHLQEVVDVGLERALPVAYHSCGAVRPIIPDLIEMGVTVLNPVQCNCSGMAPPDLKREFGRDMTFMGGVDTQGLLPNGSADDVRRATRRLIDAMTVDGGGYILAASHTVPPETPDANIFAMYDEACITREEIFDRTAQIRRENSGGAVL